MKIRQTYRLSLAFLAFATSGVAQSILPQPDAPFNGTVGLRPSDSIKDFPKEVHAPKDAPNILVILTDDVGFGATSTFGGPIPTPTFDRIAERGIRYNKFHTTALCSPTRASLLTGRNHHSVATAGIMEIGVGFPGYNTLVPQSKRGLGDLLKLNGYNTSWFGKNHNVPDWHSSQAGPFDLWPVGLGFEYFYGFIGGDTSQWAPAIVENTKPIEPPHDEPDYFFEKDMADRAIDYLRMQHAVAPEKPFFVYYAPGTAHAPHHAPEEWIQKFKGQFDQGWDEVRKETFARQKELGVIPSNARLTERNEAFPAWDSLNSREKVLYARMMEVYCAALSYCDNQMGRIIDTIDEMGELDNTLIIYIQGDNGASAEGSPQGLFNEMTFFNAIPEPFEQVYSMMDELGGPMTFNHYPVSWAHAMNTPFQWTKQMASHFGGTRNGMVMSWPNGIKAHGEVRSQFHHVIDIMPTIMEAAGLEHPELVYGVKQAPVEGVSMVYTWDNPEQPSKRQTQYFEMLGNQGIYHDGWVAATTPPAMPWEAVVEPVDPVDGYSWELYHIDEDFSESINLAEQEPAKLIELQRLFYVEAAKYQVFPIDNTKVERLDVSNRPSLTDGRDSFTYYDGMIRIPEGSAPDIKNRDWSLTAEIDVSIGGSEGVIITQGGRFSGWGLYLKDNKPVFHYNLAGVERYVIEGTALTPGKHVIEFAFKYDGGGFGKGGDAELKVDGKSVGTARFARTIAFRMSLDETLDIGEDAGTPVSEDYSVPFSFTGEIKQVVVNLK